MKLLKAGYSPFEDNTIVNNTRKHQTVLDKNTEIEDFRIPNKNSEPKVKVDIERSLKDAIDFVLKLKKQQVNERTLQDYGYRVGAFLKWVTENHPGINTINQLNKKVEILSNSSGEPVISILGI